MTDDETDIDTYGIGSADSFGVIVIGDICTVEFDLNQVHDQGFVRYTIDGALGGVGSKNTYRRTDELPIGQNIHIALADHIVDESRLEIKGFIVPDYLLGSFIEAYPDKQVLLE